MKGIVVLFLFFAMKRLIADTKLIRMEYTASIEVNKLDCTVVSGVQTTNDYMLTNEAEEKLNYETSIAVINLALDDLVHVLEKRFVREYTKYFGKVLLKSIEVDADNYLHIIFSVEPVQVDTESDINNLKNFVNMLIDEILINNQYTATYSSALTDENNIENAFIIASCSLHNSRLNAVSEWW